jgi:short subunit dehydrogenase-like uncharacterized protein
MGLTYIWFCDLNWTCKGYVATPKIVVQACYTLLLEKDKVPSGVLTPAVAFSKTRLIDRLQEQGIVFSTVQETSK